jgi:putative acetyltransferase
MIPATIRPQQSDDSENVRRVLTRSFRRETVAELAETLQREAQGRAFVAEVEGELVGHAELSRCWLDTPERILEVLVLSPLGVLPEFQRQGIGGHLVRHLLTDARKTSAPLVFLEGDPAYYARFGFRRASEHGFTSPSVQIPDPAFQVVVLPAWEPTMTGAVIYSDAFWRHDSVGRRRP